MSSKEIVTHRDQITCCNLNFQDTDFVEELRTYKSKNHEYSSKLKSKGGKVAKLKGSKLVIWSISNMREMNSAKDQNIL